MTAPTSYDDDSPGRLSPHAAAWAGDVLSRHIRQRWTNGLSTPPEAHEVFDWLTLSLDEPACADSGTRFATVDRVTAGQATVEVAAEKVGVSPEYVRRLARDGRIRCHRVGRRAWLIDLDSLQGVIAKGRRSA